MQPAEATQIQTQVTAEVEGTKKEGSKMATSSQYYVCNSPVNPQANSFSLLTLEERDQEQGEMESPVEKVHSLQSHNTPEQFLGDQHQGKEEMEEQVGSANTLQTQVTPTKPNTIHGTQDKQQRSSSSSDKKEVEI